MYVHGGKKSKISTYVWTLVSDIWAVTRAVVEFQEDHVGTTYTSNINPCSHPCPFQLSEAATTHH